MRKIPKSSWRWLFVLMLCCCIPFRTRKTAIMRTPSRKTQESEFEKLGTDGVQTVHIWIRKVKASGHVLEESLIKQAGTCLKKV